MKKMSVKVEKTENKNEVKLSFTVEAEKFDEAMKKVYKKLLNILIYQDLEKVKHQYQIVEKTYGA